MCEFNSQVQKILSFCKSTLYTLRIQVLLLDVCYFLQKLLIF